MAAKRDKSGKINHAQIKIIYTLGNSLGIVDKSAQTDNLHELVYSMTKKGSIKELTRDEAGWVIDSLKNGMRGFRKSPIPNSPGMATEGQIKKIWALLYEIKDYDKPGVTCSMKVRLRGFLKKYAKIDDMRFLTFEKANNVIEGLKGVLNTEKRKSKKNE